MLVKELNIPVIDPFRNLLADLMWTSTLDHIKSGPSILRLGTRRRADEEAVLEFSLEIVFLDVVRKSSRDFSAGSSVPSDDPSRKIK